MSRRNPLRRLRLSTLLVGINVGLLLLAVMGVAIVALRLLEQLAGEQALARVMQAGSSAHNAIEQTGDEVAADTQLLAERPTLRRLLEAGDAESLNDFLNQFQQTSQLDGAAVLIADRVFAQSGLTLNWESLWAAHGRDNGYFIDSPESGSLMLGAWSAVQPAPGAIVMTIVSLDETFAQRVSDEIGLQVTIRDRQSALAANPFVGLHASVVDTGQPISARRDDVGVYVAIFPMRAASGEVVGLVDTELPTTGVVDSLQHFSRTLLVLTLIVAAMAALVSLLFGRWLGRPLQTLANAADRIGHGDLSTPITAKYGGEIGALTATLDEMRGRLLRLTANLRRQQAESATIVASIVEGVFSVDRERRIRFVNPQLAAMLGIDPQDAIGRFCGDVLNPQAPDGTRPCEVQCPIVHARFRSGARAIEHVLLRSGQVRTVVITSAPPAENQQVQVMRDETEVEAARRLRDAVLANISHEFRTPLSAQLASIELLLDQLPGLTVEQIGELVGRLQRGTLRLTQLIDNLLESVRIEAGEYTVRRQPIALDEVIEEALEFIRPLIKQQEQEVTVELPYPLPPISGDARRLTQVFVNLLANANKFAPRGSTIHIGGAVESETIALWVEDQGPGMPPVAGQSVFDRFVRSQSEEPEQGGVGLGLWIVKSIIDRHGGRVGAASSASGTRLCVTLPRVSTNERRIIE